MNYLHQNCPYAYPERDENYTLDMCRLHPEKLWGVTEGFCLECNHRHNPQPTDVRHIHSPVDHYDVDVATGTVTYHVVTTNGDRIRSMSDEELATMLYERGCFAPNCDRYDVCYASCRECWLEWLKEEVSE